ncbi:MAG: stage V sporulation protein E, partial [Planctomycetota bacterium]
LIVAYFKFSHIKTRLLVFLYPEMDPTGKGHQIRQSLIALGSGGWMGLGLGESRQKLFFLPEDHTDFILAIIGEEFGFLGTLVVILLFLGILYYGRRIMNFASHMFGHLLAFGILFSFAFQGILNIAVVTASMPTKGISLPLISFGGSGMLSTMMAFGILLNISKARRMELIKNYFGNNKL